MTRKLVQLMSIVTVAVAFVAFGTAVGAGEKKEEKKAAKRGEQYFGGVISSIDFAGRKVTVAKKDAGSMTFQCTDTTRFFVKQKRDMAALKDFKVGDKVEVYYDEDKGVLLCHRLVEEGAKDEKIEKKLEKGR